MATKTIAWSTGSGNITLTYEGQGNGSISVESDENSDFEDRSQSFSIVTTDGTPEQAISILVTQKGKTYAVGETFDFDYTGSVQQVTLPKGKYKLQCWGAEGGTSYKSSSAKGSKGGYSEGVITLTEVTTFYIFVGGKGSRGSSTTLVNGGWNGGGASVGYSKYSSGGTNGYSYPACGGGATDISTVTSSMSYSDGRTNRSSASLLARCIVAGGGGGGSYCAKEVTTTELDYEYVAYYGSPYYTSSGSVSYWVNDIEAGERYSINGDIPSGTEYIYFFAWTSDSAYKSQRISHDTVFTVPSGSFTKYSISFMSDSANMVNDGNIILYRWFDSTSTSTTTDYSRQDAVGGGASGGGMYGGTQTAGGNGNGTDGGFGYGGNQSWTNWRYISGGAGGGWYGGGTSGNDSTMAFCRYTGGGSGFVNTAANASSRPSGYTGLQLDSGTTTSGSSSHPSTSGGTETGHSGNGYARITVLE